ncbi:MAG: M20 family metallopeptidase [Ilumatobacteraceae bacterium]
MITDLETFVNVESPSLERECLERSAHFLADLMTRVLGTPPTLIESDRGPHVHWKGSNDTKVLIVGHHDTVFPLGTVARRPFTRDGNIGRGPGIFDMKAGIVQAIYGVAAVKEWYHTEILITADEEVGSHASRDLLEERAKSAGAVLVLEPSADGGALKIARKGTGTFNVIITGRASHAGLEPEKGINALVELAAQVPRIAALARPEVGTTVTPTVAKAGTADNVVPDSATISVDVRCVIPEEKDRLERGMASLVATLPGATVTVSGGMNRPPMHESMTTELFAIAEKVAGEYAIGDLRGVAVGGGSDGNITAAVGVRTLDGLGAVGAGAHAETEHVRLDLMPERAALIAGLVQAIVNG